MLVVCITDTLGIVLASAGRLVSDGPGPGSPTAASVPGPMMALLVLFVCLLTGPASGLLRRMPDVFELVLNLPEEEEQLAEYTPQ